MDYMEQIVVSIIWKDVWKLVESIIVNKPHIGVIGFQNTQTLTQEKMMTLRGGQGVHDNVYKIVIENSQKMNLKCALLSLMIEKDLGTPGATHLSAI